MSSCLTSSTWSESFSLFYIFFSCLSWAKAVFSEISPQTTYSFEVAFLSGFVPFLFWLVFPLPCMSFHIFLSFFLSSAIYLFCSAYTLCCSISSSVNFFLTFDLALLALRRWSASVKGGLSTSESLSPELYSSLSLWSNDYFFLLFYFGLGSSSEESPNKPPPVSMFDKRFDSIMLVDQDKFKNTQIN